MLFLVHPFFLFRSLIDAFDDFPSCHICQPESKTVRGGYCSGCRQPILHHHNPHNFCPNFHFNPCIPPWPKKSQYFRPMLLLLKANQICLRSRGWPSRALASISKCGHSLWPSRWAAVQCPPARSTVGRVHICCAVLGRDQCSRTGIASLHPAAGHFLLGLGFIQWPGGLCPKQQYSFTLPSNKQPHSHPQRGGTLSAAPARENIDHGGEWRGIAATILEREAHWERPTTSGCFSLCSVCTCR